MNIAVFLDYDPNQPDAWASPSGIHRNLEKLGHNVKRYPLPSTDKTLGFRLFKDEGFKPDFCLLFNAGSLREGTPYWSKDELGNVPLVLEAGDEPQAYQAHTELSNNSDLILSPDSRCVRLYQSRGLNAHWWTHWCDEEIFYQDENQKPNYEVVSSMFGNRPTINQITSMLGNKFVNKTGLIGKENGDWLRSGKIVIQEARYGEVTRRIFEGMGCGRLVFTNSIAPETDIYSLFTHKKDIIYYNTPNECVELIDYYLHNDNEREEIAKSGYEKVMNNHTSKARTEVLLEKVGEIL